MMLYVYLLLLLQLMRVMVRAGLVAATFGDGLGTFHHECAAGRAEASRRLGLDGVPAIGVVGARIKYAETSAFLDHLSLAALRAFHAGRIL